MAGWKRLIHMWCMLSVCLLIAACGGGGAAAPQGPINISALLTADQETSATTSSATGVGTVTVDLATGKISGVLVTNGIVGTAAHIHDGAAGTSGPVVIPLAGGPTVWTVPDGAVLTPDQLAKLNSGGLYFNVHTAANPGGEIRGQITQQVRFASLSGANETSAVTTTASGVGVLALNPATKQVSGFVKTTNLTGTAAHVHDGAAGVAGPVIIPLTETSAGSGVWVVPANSTLTDDQIAKFSAGGLYFNVHSAANPGGEIRGQILIATLTIKNAILNGTQEVPTVATGATGTGIAVVNSTTHEVFGGVKSAGITGTLAHIHDGAVGVNGGVVVALAETPAGSGVWLVPDNSVLNVDQLAKFNVGGLYFNVHSAAFQTGEIRGQINIVQASSVFTLGGGTTISAPVQTGAPQQIVFPSSGLSFSNHIQVIFNTNCIPCHALGRVASFMPLTQGVSYGNLVNVSALSPIVTGTRVIPGDPTNSVLFKRVSGIGLPDPSLRMPLGGPFLNSNAENAIRAWIAEGALNN